MAKLLTAHERASFAASVVKQQNFIDECDYSRYPDSERRGIMLADFAYLRKLQLAATEGVPPWPDTKPSWVGVL